MGGYRVRGGVYHDQLLYELEAGARSRNWLVQAKLEGGESTVEPQDLAGAPVVTPLPGGGGAFQVIVGDQNSTKLRGSLARRFGRTWWKLSFVDLLAGQNTIDGTEIALGIFFERGGQQ
jgi:hypothetical protein